MVKTAPTNWLENYEISDATDFTPSKYSITSSTARNHDLFGKIRNNSFDMTSDYRFGLVYGVSFFTGVCLILLILATAVSMYIKNNGGFSFTKERTPGRSGLNYVFLLSWLIALGGLVLFICGIIDLNIQINRVNSNLRTFSNGLLSIESFSNAALGIAESLVEVIDESFKTVLECVIGDSMSSSTSFSDQYTNGFEDVLSDIENISDSPSSTDLYGKVNGIIGLINESELWRWALPAIFTFSMIVSLVAYAFLSFDVIRRGKALYRKYNTSRCAQNFTRIVIASTYITYLFVWITLCIYFIFAMIAGDFCQNPDLNALSFTDNNSVGSYYMTCSSDVEDTFKDLQIAQTSLIQSATEAVTLLKSNTPLVSDACAQTIDTDFINANNLAYEIGTLLGSMAEFVDCSFGNKLYVDSIFEAGCHDCNRALEYVITGLLIASLSLIVSVIAWQLMVEQALDAQVSTRSFQSSEFEYTDEMSPVQGTAIESAIKHWAPPPDRADAVNFSSVQGLFGKISADPHPSI